MTCKIKQLLSIPKIALYKCKAALMVSEIPVWDTVYKTKIEYVGEMVRLGHLFVFDS